MGSAGGFFATRAASVKKRAPALSADNSMGAGKRAFRARAAWDGGRLLREPTVIEEEGRIVRVLEGGSDRQAERVVDFGNAILLPGFINAHCHLEYSCIQGRLPRGLPFAEWIGRMARFRHELP